MSLIQFAKKLIVTPARAVDPDGTQCGAIPFRIIDGQVVFLMITSRRSAHWVFPKGSVELGMTPRQTAVREAFEEAGVRGEVGKTPIGYYVHPRNDDVAGLVRVELFALEVTEQIETWPEEAQRFRHWALLPQVKRLMASKQAARVAADLNRRLLSGN